MTTSSADRLDAVKMSVWTIEFKRVSNLRLASRDLAESAMIPFATSWASFAFICSSTGGVEAWSPVPEVAAKVIVGVFDARYLACIAAHSDWMWFDVWADVGVGTILDPLAAQRNGRIVLREAEARGSVSSFSASYSAPASIHAKKMSTADGEIRGAMAWGKNGGIEIALVKYESDGVASRAAVSEASSLIALIVAQQGHSTSFIVRIDLGVNLTGVAEVPKPVRPKYSSVGFSRSPPTFEI